MRVCTSCGERVQEDAVFCPKCGNRFVVKDTETEEIRRFVNCAKNGDMDAIEILMNSTRNKMFFKARGLLHNEEDAKEVVQRSYIKAFATLQSLADPSAFVPWLSTIVSHQAIDYMRKADKQYQVTFSDLTDTDDAMPFDTADERVDTQPEMAYDAKQKKEILQQILDTLPDEQRIAVMLYFYDQKTTKQIAEEVGCKETTVKARLRYAKAKIKESVLDLEKKQGIKLYDLAPVAFFVLLLKGCSQEETSLSPADTSASAHFNEPITETVKDNNQDPSMDPVSPMPSADPASMNHGTGNDDPVVKTEDTPVSQKQKTDPPAPVHGENVEASKRTDTIPHVSSNTDPAAAPAKNATADSPVSKNSSPAVHDPAPSAVPSAVPAGTAADSAVMNRNVLQPAPSKRPAVSAVDPSVAAASAGKSAAAAAGAATAVHAGTSVITKIAIVSILIGGGFGARYVYLGVKGRFTGTYQGTNNGITETLKIKDDGTCTFTDYGVGIGGTYTLNKDKTYDIAVDAMFLKVEGTMVVSDNKDTITIQLDQQLNGTGLDTKEVYYRVK
jgi:RNA polymerase sigma factor (sigma-70 family)